MAEREPSQGSTLPRQVLVHAARRVPISLFILDYTLRSGVIRDSWSAGAPRRYPRHRNSQPFSEDNFSLPTPDDIIQTCSATENQAGPASCLSAGPVRASSLCLAIGEWCSVHEASVEHPASLDLPRSVRMAVLCGDAAVIRLLAVFCLTSRVQIPATPQTLHAQPCLWYQRPCIGYGEDQMS